MASLVTTGKALAISTACNTLFGFSPSITYTDNQAVIRFTPDQNAAIRNYVVSQMLNPDEGDIDIDLAPIAAPYVVGGLSLAFLLGVITFSIFGPKTGRRK